MSASEKEKQKKKEMESQKVRDERVRKLWDRMNVKHSDALSIDALRDGLREIDHPLQSQDQMLHELLRACDTSKDGLIDYEEFRSFIERTEDHLWKLFQAIDRDKNGKLDREELSEALSKQDIKVEKAKLEAFFDRLDKNNDGEITFEEWRDFLVFIPSIDTSLKVIYQYVSSTINVNAEGDVMVSDDLYEGLGYFAAGGLAGAVSRTATAPFDRLKVYLIAQTDVGSGKIAKAAAQGNVTEVAKRAGGPIKDALRVLWRAGGVRSFFAGNGLNVIKVLPESAIKFGSFEAAKRFFARLEGKEDVKELSSVSRFVAGGVGGVCSQVAIYPIDTLKFRMQCEMVEGGAKGNQLIAQTAKNLWRSGGIPAYYRGLVLGVVGIFPYSAIDLGTFEALKRAYITYSAKKRGLPEEDIKVGNWAVLGIGATSGSVGASAVYPINLLRTRLQAQGTAQHPQTYTGMWDVTQRTVQREGLKGLFKGLTPNLLKVIPAVSISYLVYENSKRLMDLP